MQVYALLFFAWFVPSNIFIANIFKSTGDAAYFRQTQLEFQTLLVKNLKFSDSIKCGALKGLLVPRICFYLRFSWWPPHCHCQYIQKRLHLRHDRYIQIFMLLISWIEVYFCQQLRQCFADWSNSSFLRLDGIPPTAIQHFQGMTCLCYYPLSLSPHNMDVFLKPRLSSLLTEGVLIMILVTTERYIIPPPYLSCFKL